MKFKDLIKKHSTQSIIRMIHELYPKQRRTLGVYRKIVQIIKNTKVKNPDRTIFVEKSEIDGVIFLDTYFTKGIGKVKTLLKYYRGDKSMIVQMVKNTLNYLNKNVDTYSLINIKANKIGSYKVDKTSVETFGELRVIVEVLYKMTWFCKKNIIKKFDSNKIKGKNNRLHKANSQYNIENGIYAPLNNRFYPYRITTNRNKRIYIKNADATNLTFGEINHPTSLSSEIKHTGLTVGIDTSGKKSDFTVECQYIDGKIVSTSVIPSN